MNGPAKGRFCYYIWEKPAALSGSFHKKLFSVFLILVSFSFFSCRSHKESISSTPKTETSSSTKRLEKKYAELLQVNPDDINNLKLYAFIDGWYGVPYQYGGKTKSGIDCSGFAATLYREVYKQDISGSSETIFQKCKAISADNLKEGDLVFFKIEQNKISHIGVYLQNHKFVHASTKKGVRIDDLNDAYYKKYFFKGGKLK